MSSDLSRPQWRALNRIHLATILDLPRQRVAYDLVRYQAVSQEDLMHLATLDLAAPIVAGGRPGPPVCLIYHKHWANVRLEITEKGRRLVLTNPRNRLLYSLAPYAGRRTSLASAMKSSGLDRAVIIQVSRDKVITFARACDGVHVEGEGSVRTLDPRDIKVIVTNRGNEYLPQ